MLFGKSPKQNLGEINFCIRNTKKIIVVLMNYDGE